MSGSDRVAGQGPCRYWIPFSNGMLPDERVPRSGYPDFEPEFDHRDLTDYLIMSRGFTGRTSLTSVDAVLNITRYFASVTIGSGVTFCLLFLMQHLISMGAELPLDRAENLD